MRAQDIVAEWWWAELPLSADIRSRRGPLFAQTLGPQSPPTSGHRQNNSWYAEQLQGDTIAIESENRPQGESKAENVNSWEEDLDRQEGKGGGRQFGKRGFGGHRESEA